MAQPIRSLDIVDVPMTSSQNNTATLLTQAGVHGQSWYVCYGNWRISGGSTGAANISLTIKDGETIIYKSAIPGSSPNGTALQMDFSHPIKITEGNSVTLDIGASGTTNTLIHANFGLFLR